MTHAYTATVLFVVAVKLCLIKLPKTESGKKLDSQTSTKQTKALSNKRTTERTENIFAIKRNVPAISSPVVSKKSLRQSKHRAIE